MVKSFMQGKRAQQVTLDRYNSTKGRREGGWRGEGRGGEGRMKVL